MKLKSLSLAIAASVVATQSFALTKADLPAEITVPVSGATAVDFQFEEYIKATCDSDLDKYLVLTDENKINDKFRAYYCKVDGKKVLFLKNSRSSSFGVAPIYKQETVQFMDINHSSCQAVPATFSEDEKKGATMVCGEAATQDLTAKIGVSDVEPQLFTIKDNGEKLPKSLLNSGNVTVNVTNAATFGVVVTPELRNALQEAQGLAVGSDDISQMPTLSQDIIANIFAGNLASWNTLVDAAGTGVATLADASDVVNVCVRKPGSGTQAQFNAFYNGNACLYNGAGNSAFVGFSTAVDSDTALGGPVHMNAYYPPINDNGDDWADLAEECELTLNENGFVKTPLSADQYDCLKDELGVQPSPWVHAAEGSSDMGRCLTQIGKMEDSAGKSYLAIGVQSLEKVKETSSSKNRFKFIKINGIAPTVDNVASGLYRNWAAATIQWHNSEMTADLLPFAEGFVNRARSVADVAAVNAKFNAAVSTPQIKDGAGNANVGLLAFAKPGQPAPAVFNPLEPIMPFNKGLTNSSTCANAQLVDKINVGNTGQ